MQDPFPIPSCFSSSDKFSVDADPTSAFGTAKPGQTVVSSVHRTKIAGHIRLITVTWCRNLLAHGLSVSVQSPDTGGGNEQPERSSSSNNTCKVELKSWYFWRKQGSKRFDIDGNHVVRVFWDLRRAKFSGEPEPRSDYYVALVSNDEVVLLLGDLKKEAYKRTGCRPAAIEAALVSKKEHVFGKRRFSTTTRFQEKGKHHEVSIECGSSGAGGKLDPQMVVKIDGQVAIHVKHLQWKFRGNETISLNKERVEVYWDVHDWLFSPGLRHALFIFKPLPAVQSSLLTSSSSSSCNSSDQHGVPSSSFCLFLYAWKIE